MRGPPLTGTVGYSVFWASARRVELVAIVACAAISAVFWGQALPTQLLRPDLSPEQMVQLLAALQASCLVLTVRREPGDYARMASVGMTGRRLGWVAGVLLLTLLVAVAAGLAMPATVADEYLRNVAVYVGAGLALGSLSTTLGLAVPWIWFALCVTLGQTSEQGIPVTDWWAYPLQDASWHPEAAVALVCVGILAWWARR